MVIIYPDRPALSILLVTTYCAKQKARTTEILARKIVKSDDE